MRDLSFKSAKVIVIDKVQSKLSESDDGESQICTKMNFAQSQWYQAKTNLSAAFYLH